MRLSPELQSEVREARAELRVGYPWWLRPFMMSSVVGITLGRRVYVSRGVAGSTPRDLERLVRHELVHVRQMTRLGLFRFLCLYVREYLANRRRGMNGAEAYRRITFEIEACAAEEIV